MPANALQQLRAARAASLQLRAGVAAAAPASCLPIRCWRLKRCHASLAPPAFRRRHACRAAAIPSTSRLRLCTRLPTTAPTTCRFPSLTPSLHWLPARKRRHERAGMGGTNNYVSARAATYSGEQTRRSRILLPAGFSSHRSIRWRFKHGGSNALTAAHLLAPTASRSGAPWTSAERTLVDESMTRGDAITRHRGRKTQHSGTQTTALRAANSPVVAPRMPRRAAMLHNAAICLPTPPLYLSLKTRQPFANNARQRHRAN